MRYLFLFLFIPSIAFTQNLNGPNGLDLDKYNVDPLNSYVLNIDNPCQDSLYLELKKIPLDEMSDRQFEIFKQKDKACQEYQKTLEVTEAGKQNAETFEKANKAASTYYVIAGVSLVASTIFLLTI